MTVKIDSHQHFWNYTDNAADYVWMSEEHAALKQDFSPEDLALLQTDDGYTGSIAVQAREVLGETDYLLSLASEHDIIKGVVGWVDLCDQAVHSQLEQYSDDLLLKGFRMLIHDREDVDFADSHEHSNGIGLLARHGWTYDLLLRSAHLPAAIRLVDQFPNQPFVVDHVAKPCVDKSDWTLWQRGIKSLAERKNVYCKLSGLVTEGDWNAWHSDEFSPFLEETLNAFGPQRCMIGSDWPVCTLAADYATALGVVESWISPLSEDEQAQILSGTCIDFYGLTG